LGPDPEPGGGGGGGGGKAATTPTMATARMIGRSFIVRFLLSPVCEINCWWTCHFPDLNTFEQKKIGPLL